MGLVIEPVELWGRTRIDGLRNRELYIAVRRAAMTLRCPL